MEDYIKLNYPNLPYKVWDKVYKKTATGAINEWQVAVVGDTILTAYGQVEGKLQMVTESVEGKNVGRSNETSNHEQALAEAESAWKKKSEKDGHTSQESAREETDKTSSTGGYLPMLAKAYEDHIAKIKYPCYVQPKLDGARCIAMKIDNEVKLFSRTGKEVNTVPHLMIELNRVMKNGEIFDGEIYNHGGDFNEDVGSLRATVNTDFEKTADNSLWIYDCPRIDDYTEEDSFALRSKALELRLNGFNDIKDLILVPTHEVFNFEAIKSLFKSYTSDSYEGVMIRQKNMKYEQKRTSAY